MAVIMVPCTMAPPLNLHGETHVIHVALHLALWGRRQVSDAENTGMTGEPRCVREHRLGLVNSKRRGRLQFPSQQCTSGPEQYKSRNISTRTILSFELFGTYSQVFDSLPVSMIRR